MFNTKELSENIKKFRIAKEILEKNAERLAFVINKAYEKYDCGNEVILSGGLITNNNIFSGLIKQKLNPDLKAIIPEYPQIMGACLLCTEMCGCDIKNIYKNFMRYYKV